MSVESPYIIKLHQFWKTNKNSSMDYTYLVLELCSHNLRQEIKKDIPFDKKLRYLEHMVSGLDTLFAQNIIHRDLKFENILVTKEQVAKITDFGLAKDMGAMSAVASLRCGTPYTMAPEIFFSNGYPRPMYSQKCDIWSLAVLLHEIVHGRHPFNYQS
jgi:serine/threonine protein kinase